MKNNIDIISAIEKNKFLSVHMRTAILILSIYNCRAGEVLSANKKDFYSGKFLILHGSKGSADIIIRDRFLLKIFETLKPDEKGFYFWSIDYPKLYRCVKENYSHLFVRFRTKQNYKVTHGFRYINASCTNDAKSVKAILNHNSKKSGKYYNKQIKL